MRPIESGPAASASSVIDRLAQSVNVLWGGVVGLVLLSLVGIGVVADPQVAASVAVDTTTSTTADTTTTTFHLTFDTTTTTVSSTTSTTRKGATTTSTTAPDTTAKEPGPAQLAKPGKYDYRRTADENSATNTTTITNGAKHGDGSIEQTVSLDGAGNSFVNYVVWSGASSRLTRTTYSLNTGQGEAKGECDWTPDVDDYVFPLTKGKTWKVDSSCTMSVNGQTVKIHRTGSAEVGDFTRVTITGTPVDVWTINRTDSSETTLSAGKVTTLTTLTEFVSPKHGLRVRSTGTTKFDGNLGGKTSTRESKVTEELLNLEPN